MRAVSIFKAARQFGHAMQIYIINIIFVFLEIGCLYDL